MVDSAVLSKLATGEATVADSALLGRGGCPGATGGALDSMKTSGSAAHARTSTAGRLQEAGDSWWGPGQKAAQRGRAGGMPEALAPDPLPAVSPT